MKADMSGKVALRYSSDFGRPMRMSIMRSGSCSGRYPGMHPARQPPTLNCRHCWSREAGEVACVLLDWRPHVSNAILTK